MRKTSKPASKKAPAKKPAAKKSPSKPKWKAQGQSELAGLVARLATITEQLAEIADRLAQAALPPLPAHHAVEAPRTRTDEHADDLEVPTVPEE